MPAFPQIPLMYHPTNVLLLDDDRKFLNDINFMIDEAIPVVLNTDPDEVLSYLASHTFRKEKLSELISKQSFEINPAQGLASSELFEVNFTKLRGNLDSPERYKIVLILFVDKMMPNMDGLEFCRKVREAGFPVKLILFTGKMGLGEAVSAFNQGLIDGYLTKDDPKLDVKINELIQHYAWEQFVELSDKLSGFLSHIMRPLQDQQFFEAFEKVRHENGIVEFYLLDSSCSFLMINNEGEAKLLLVRNEEDFNEAHEIAKDSKAAYEVLQALRSRQMFPVTRGNHADYEKLIGDAWESAMKPMTKIPGRELYYTVIEQPAFKVFSFKKYRGEVWPTP